MGRIVSYLIAWLLCAVAVLPIHRLVGVPQWYLSNVLFVQCTSIGIVGGILYCLRSVYLNKCVRKQWDPDWEIWYYLRPLASAITGFVSCIFLKAGLLVLQADVKPDAVGFGYLAVAFIAGYNVDNFAKKLEDVASSVWGIRKSRASGDVNLSTPDSNEQGKGSP